MEQAYPYLADENSPEVAASDVGEAAPIFLRIILVGAVFMLLLASGSQWVTERESFIAQICMAALAAATLLLGFLGRGWRIRMPAESLCAVIYCIWAITGFFIVQAEYLSFFRGHFMTLIKVVALYLVIVNLIRSRKDFLWMLSSYVLVVGAVILIVPEAFSYRPQQGGELQRASGITGDSNDTALLGMVCLFSLLALFTSSRHRTFKLLCLAATPVGVWMVLISGSRSGMFGLLLAAMLFYVWYIRGQMKERGGVGKLGGFMLGAGVIFGIFLVLAAGPFWHRVLETVGAVEYRTERTKRGERVRLRMAISGLKLAARHPVMGVGQNMYYWSIVEVDPGLVGRASHNAWVSAVTSTGVPGLIIWTTGALLVTRRAWRLRKNPSLSLRDRGLVSLCLVFLMYYWFRSFFFYEMTHRVMWPFVGGITGYLVAVSDYYGYGQQAVYYETDSSAATAVPYGA